MQVDFELKQIVAYDSLPEAGRKLDCSRALRAVHRFVSDLHLQEKQTCFDWSGWEQAHVRVCDQSGPDWYNCGVFAYFTWRCGASRDAPPSLSCRMWRLKIWLPPFWPAVSRGGASSSYCGCARVKSLGVKREFRYAFYTIIRFIFRYVCIPVKYLDYKGPYRALDK